MGKKKTTSRKAGKGAFDGDTRIVLLHGAEEMLKREYRAQLRETLEAAHGEIQIIDFNGSKSALSDVLDELRTFSLMQQHKLVVVYQAEDFVKEDTRPALERYADAPLDHATLLLIADGWRPGRLDKKIEKVGCKIKCEPLKDAEAARWLVERSKKHHQRTLAPQAAQAMVDRLGKNLGKLDSELSKLALLVEPDETIQVSMIDQIIGRSSDEKAWVIQQAILEALNQRGGAHSNTQAIMLNKIHELVDLAGNDPIPVLWSVSDLMRKLNLAVVMQQQGAHERAIAAEFRLWGETQRHFFGVLRRLDEKKAGTMFDRVLVADSRSKSGFGDVMRNLECFCVQLADELN